MLNRLLNRMNFGVAATLCILFIYSPILLALFITLDRSYR